MNMDAGVLANKGSTNLGTRSIGPVELMFCSVAAIAGVVAVILSFNLMTLFTPVRVTILAGVVVALLLGLCGLSVAWRDRRLSPWLIIALVTGLFLASHLDPRYFANQDEGYYTAMAEMMARGEPIDFVDKFLLALPPDLQRLYYDEAGIDISWIRPNLGYINFYPLHPALMALARQLLGPGMHTAELLAAFAVVIIAIYLLTYELSGGARGWAEFAAMLAAVNPSLVFFAKFPVTEINAAAMLMPAGYHLLAGFRARASSLSAFHGSVFVLLILGYCFARMSFPVIAPFLVCVTVLGFVVAGVQTRQKVFLLMTLCGACAVFGASLLYYHFRQPDLLREIVKGTYLPSLWRGRWLIALGGALGLAAMIAAAVPRWRQPALAAARRGIDFVGRWILPYPGLAIVILSIPTMYVVVKTGVVEALEFNQPPGLQLLHFHALYVLMLFVSPFLFLLLLARVRPAPDVRERAELLPSFWLICCWPVILSYAPVIPYLYYYGRYITLEILPIAIIAIALTARRSVLPAGVVRTLAVLGLAWSLLFSIPQINLADGEIDAPFHRIAAQLQKGDVLAMDWDGHGGSAFTVPLRHALGLSILNVTDAPSTEKHAVLEKLQAVAGGRLYLLSKFDPAKNPAYAGVGLVPLDRFPFAVEDMGLNGLLPGIGKWLLPTTVHRWEPWTLYLSRISRLEPGGDAGQPVK